MSHSILPPSSAGIWGAPGGCTGWVLMAQMYPETESTEDALNGEASHEIAAQLIYYAARGVNSTKHEEFTDEVASNGVVYTEEMFDAAKIYADDVSAVMRDTGIFGGENFGTEKRVHALSINDLLYGTTDQFIANNKPESGGHLYVWDYKFGHDPVDAFENWQLISYVCGIKDSIDSNLFNWMAKYITVHMRVVQPRAFHREGVVREWVITLDKLAPYFEILRENAAIALSNESVTRTGPHCKNCQARINCDAALKAGISLYEVAMQPTPIDLSHESLGVQAAIVDRAINQLSALKSGYDEQIKSIVKNGGSVPNYIVEMGHGNLDWILPVKDVIELGKQYDFDLKKPDAVITPTQAKTKGFDPETVKLFSNRPKRGLKVIPDDGKKAKKVFSQ